MANDFSGDSDCVALWRFESGALTTDSKGTNTLTDHNTVTENTSIYKEGACAAEFELDRSEYLDITDANLDSGFPFKNGESNNIISVCFWIRRETYGVDYSGVLTKWDSTGDARSFGIWNNYAAYNKMTVVIGYNSGVSAEYKEHASTLTSEQWYHVGVTYNGSTKAYRIRIWDDTAQAILGSDAVGTTTNSPYISAADLCVGARQGPSHFLDSIIDELVVFKRILTTDEIDAIRAGIYTASGSVCWGHATGVEENNARRFSGNWTGTGEVG